MYGIVVDGQLSILTLTMADVWFGEQRKGKYLQRIQFTRIEPSLWKCMRVSIYMAQESAWIVLTI